MFSHSATEAQDRRSLTRLSSSGINFLVRMSVYGLRTLERLTSHLNFHISLAFAHLSRGRCEKSAYIARHLLNGGKRSPISEDAPTVAIRLTTSVTLVNTWIISRSSPSSCTEDEHEFHETLEAENLFFHLSDERVAHGLGDDRTDKDERVIDLGWKPWYHLKHVPY